MKETLKENSHKVLSFLLGIGIGSLPIKSYYARLNEDTILPYVGGVGRGIFIIIGFSLMILSLSIYIVRKGKKDN